MEDSFGETTSISEGTIRSTARSRYAMWILMFLNDNGSAFTTQDIANELDLWWTTADYNIKELLECEFVKIVEDRKSGWKYYQIAADKKLIERMTNYYKKWAGFRLARLVPSNKRITAEQLKREVRFIEKCQNYYGLSLSEGVNAVLRCSKIEFERHSNRIFLRRKEQGFIPPSEKPKEPEKTETRKEPEVEEVE